MTFPPYAPPNMINPQHKPGLGCYGQLAILFVIIIMIIIAVGPTLVKGLSAAPAAPVTQAPAELPPATPTPVVLMADLTHLQETAAALDNETHKLANDSTAIVLQAQRQQVEQQFIIFATQQALAARYQGMTQTVIAGNDAQSTRQAQRTAAAGTARSEYVAVVTQTARVIQATQGAATEAALASQFIGDQNRRAWLEQVAGLEAVFWRIIVPLFILCICALLAWGAALMWARKYKMDRTPQEVLPQTWTPRGQKPISVHAKIESAENDGRTLKFGNLELPGTPEQIYAFVGGVLDGVSVAEENWVGDGKPFSVDDYRPFRDAWIDSPANLAKWKHPDALWNTDPHGPRSQSWKLLPAGLEVCAIIKREMEQPTPDPIFMTN